MVKAWVYILRCADGAVYTGYTTDLKRRLREHQGGRGAWTRRRLPVELAFSYEMSRQAAKVVEQRIKGWTRARKEALIAREPGAMQWLERTIAQAEDE